MRSIILKIYFSFPIFQYPVFFGFILKRYFEFFFNVTSTDPFEAITIINRLYNSYSNPKDNLYPTIEESLFKL